MIIFLYGTSSSGKTSIAKEILKQSKLDFIHLKMDNMFEKDPEQMTINNRTVYVHGTF